MGSELALCTTILRVSWPWWGKDVFMDGLWLPALAPPPDTYMYTAAVCGRNTLQLRVLINENYRWHEHLVVRQAVDPAQ